MTISFVFFAVFVLAGISGGVLFLTKSSQRQSWLEEIESKRSPRMAPSVEIPERIER